MCQSRFPYRALAPLYLARKAFIILCASITCGLCSGQSEYKVQRGDTLYGISRSFNLPLSRLLETNKLKESDRLVEGRILIIPGPRASLAATTLAKTYVVKSGDTLYGVARAQGVELESILSLNKISKDSKLKVGQKLLIPASDSQGSPGSTPKPPQQSPKPNGSVTPGKTTYSNLGKATWPIAGKSTDMTGKLKGVEIEGKEGDPIRSISRGKVMATGPYRGFSQVVIVERDERHIYIYGGQARIFVSPGDAIQSGTILGELGLDAKTGKALMFFIVYQNGKAINPADAPQD